MTPSEFAAKWKGSTRNERAAAQEHFIDLCRMLGVQTPNEADPHGDWYAFEKGAEKLNGEDGFADVWKRDHFGWEYKGKKKDLAAAYQQLLQYRESLENPPLLVVCDLNRFEVHTNFTGTKAAVHAFTLDDLRTSPAEPLRVLRAVMQHPDVLRPTKTRAQITEEVAQQFAGLAEKLRGAGHDPQKVAHFLNRLLFCFFAEDVGVLPRGLMTRILQATHAHPAKFTAQLQDLFSKMHAGGGFFGAEEIEWFNGGLFDDAEVLPLGTAELDTLLGAAKMDWSSVEPAILGTLFERGLDPAKRSQLGAHYTDKASILRIVEPVVIKPLRREFEQVKVRIQKLLAAGKKATAEAKGKENPNRIFRQFLARLRAVRVLDPACGSGNFLYVTLQLLKDLEKEVILWAAETMHTPQEFPGVGPEAVRGIELNPYAAELARVTIWIGEIQWMINNGFAYRTNPILRPLETVECRDAVLDSNDPDHPRRTTWPETEFIVGNPPFLGGKQMRDKRDGLGDAYVNALFKAWRGQVPREADFVCYWHEQAREMIENDKCRRAGLIATKGIRTGANLKVLKRIKETGGIFEAWSNQPWVVEGADVRISIICQDDGTEADRFLDGAHVDVIHANLSGGAAGKPDVTVAKKLKENEGTAFMGDTKGGAFDVTAEVARQLLAAGPNPHGKRNSDVVVPWMNAMDMTRRSREMFIIDFGVDRPEQDAAQYEAPFEYVKKHVQEARSNSRTTEEFWYQHERARPDMRAALAPLSRFIITPRTAKHRVFGWAQRPTLPDCQLITIAREDDFAFGVLHSRVHEVWSLATIRRQGVGNDPVYAPSFAFEPFPFPWPLNTPDAKLTKAQVQHRNSIAAAAKALDDVRSRWLNPPELLKAEPAFAPGLPKRLAPKDPAAATELKKRTLTNLYNARPAWIENLHRALDRAVLAAYGWPEDISDEQILANLLVLNAERSQ
jgi:type II restriction/modification system DNA methylase subunit YeeA